MPCFLTCRFSTNKGIEYCQLDKPTLKSLFYCAAVDEATGGGCMLTAGDEIYFGCQGGIFDAKQAVRICRSHTNITAMCFLEQAILLATKQGSLAVHDKRAGAAAIELQSKQGLIAGLAVCADCRKVAVGTSTDAISLVDIRFAQQPLLEIPHFGFSPATANCNIRTPMQASRGDILTCGRNNNKCLGQYDLSTNECIAGVQLPTGQILVATEESQEGTGFLCFGVFQK